MSFNYIFVRKFQPQPLEKVIKWMKNIKETEEEQKKRIVFLSSFVSGFKEQLHADILLKPGDDGPPIPAHRALLVTSMISTSCFFLCFVYINVNL